VTTAVESGETFACFGSSCSVLVTGEGNCGDSDEAVRAARGCLEGWHEQFTRFDADSELCRLNDDRRAELRVSPIMASFVDAVVKAAERTGGLVDGTLLTEIEQAGYSGELDAPVALDVILRLAPPRRPAAPRAGAPWRSLSVELEPHIVRRPPGLRLDGGGLAKGLFADVLGKALATHRSYAVSCAGDLRVGGSPRPVRVESPFDGTILHTFELGDAGVATSGIGKRSWLGVDGRPRHHLLDPSTGRPAFTGVVQVTAIAPTALEAEVRAKAALLSGPDRARRWIPRGGVVVLDDRSVEVIEP
jgi:thiamine biosynthesis lipoprotein